MGAPPFRKVLIANRGEIACRIATVLRQRGVSVDAATLKRGLAIESGYVGDGYGHPSPAGERAMERAAALGLTLDPTYTAKTFAKVLDMASHLRETGRARPLRIVYLHTLSSAPLEPLLAAPEAPAALPPALERLFTR